MSENPHVVHADDANANAPAIESAYAPAVQPNCLEVMTLQSGAFKVLLEALKDLLTDTCICFDETGMKIVAMDTTHIVMVYLRLDATKFEYFHCPKPMSIGVNVHNMHKLIKTINNNDKLTFFVDAEDMNHLGIKIENTDKNTKTTYKLNLLEFYDPDFTIPPADNMSIITLQSSDFQKICRDMSNLADVMEIKNFRNQLIFGCKGDFCSQETILSDTDNIRKGFYSRSNPNPTPTQTAAHEASAITRDMLHGLSVNNETDTETSHRQEDDSEIIQGMFNIKNLVLFTKCTNLCPTVELYLKNDYPIIVRYAVATLGDVRLCLVPQTDQEQRSDSRNPQGGGFLHPSGM